MPAEALPGEAELRALFDGKRDSVRHPCHVGARLEGARGPAGCTVLDLSETGALVQIDEAEFVAADQAGSLTTYLEMLQVHAKDGLTLAFPTHRLRLAAHLVRFTSGSAGVEPTRVGLRFDRTLSTDEVLALRSGANLPGPAAGHDDPPPPPPTHEPRRGVRLSGLVFLALKPEVGPLCLGEPRRFGREHVTLRMAPGPTEGELRQRLESGALYVSLLEGNHVLHETTARVGGVLPGPDGALEVTLLSHGGWSAPLLRRLRSA
jgi:hypothetical protein